MVYKAALGKKVKDSQALSRDDKITVGFYKNIFKKIGLVIQKYFFSRTKLPIKLNLDNLHALGSSLFKQWGAVRKNVIEFQSSSEKEKILLKRLSNQTLVQNLSHLGYLKTCTYHTLEDVHQYMYNILPLTNIHLYFLFSS